MTARKSISKKDPQTITIDNHLSLVISESGHGSSNLFGIEELLNEKPLVVEPGTAAKGKK